MTKNKKTSYSGTSSSLIIMVFSSLSAGLIFGVIVGAFWLGNNSVLGKSDYDGAYNNAMAAANSKLISSGMLGKDGVKTLSGEVVEASDGKIVFNAPLPSPLLNDSLKTRTALITAQTEVIVKKRKSLTEQKKDNIEGSAMLEPLEKRSGELKSKISACKLDERGSGVCLGYQEELDKLREEIVKIYKEKMSDTSPYDVKPSDLNGVVEIVVEASDDVSNKAEFEATKIELTKLPQDDNLSSNSLNVLK